WRFTLFSEPQEASGEGGCPEKRVNRQDAKLARKSAGRRGKAGLFPLVPVSALPWRPWRLGGSTSSPGAKGARGGGGSGEEGKRPRRQARQEERRQKRQGRAVPPRSRLCFPLASLASGRFHLFSRGERRAGRVGVRRRG